MQRKRSPRALRFENALREVMNLLYPGGKGIDMYEAMLRRYGSASAIIEAGKYMLMGDGLSESDALLISLIPEMVRNMHLSGYGEHPTLRTFVDVQEYLRTCYLGVYIEKFYMLALEANGKLIAKIHLQSGTEDSAPFYLRHVLSETVRINAKAIVLVHNHPNNTPRPSKDDIECTLQLLTALNAIGSPMLDHIIMVGKHAVSMRGFGYIPEWEWMGQAPDSKLLRGWLKDWDMEKSAETLAKIDRHEKGVLTK